MTELWNAGVSGLLDAYESGVASPFDIVQVFLDRIDRLDPAIGAFTQVLPEAALEEASAISKLPYRRPKERPLHGIPVAVKEIVDVKGASVTFSSDVFADRIAQHDSEVVKRLKDAGAIVIGMTRSHEFAWGITTQHPRNGGTKNPWSETKTPGGSSGGSAAAVAMRLVPLAIGTDTGGSIRIPAAFCGVSGFKPSWGKVSERGVLPLAPSLDHIGVLAASASDLSVAFRAIAGGDPMDPYSVPARRETRQCQRSDASGLRLIVASQLQVPALSKSYKSAFDEFLASVSGAGASVVEAEADPSLDQHLLEIFGTVQLAEAYHIHARILRTFPTHADRYGGDVAERLRTASQVAIGPYIEGRQRMTGVKMSLSRLLTGYDALLLPVGAAGPSNISDPDLGRVDDREMPLREVVMNYTTPANLAGLPACTIPIGRDEGGVPIGVQIIGAADEDDEVLDIAHALQVAAGFDIQPAPATG